MHMGASALACLLLLVSQPVGEFDAAPRVHGVALSGLLRLDCEPSRTVVCNTIDGKLPSLTRPLGLPSHTSGLAPADALQLERALAIAFASVPVMEDALLPFFFERLSRFVTGASTADPDDALRLAFGSGSQANAGYVGPDVAAVRDVLEHGNFRERRARSCARPTRDCSAQRALTSAHASAAQVGTRVRPAEEPRDRAAL